MSTEGEVNPSAVDRQHPVPYSGFADVSVSGFLGLEAVEYLEKFQVHRPGGFLWRLGRFLSSIRRLLARPQSFEVIGPGLHHLFSFPNVGASS